MISKIGIENFRIFKNQTEFNIKPITVLTGANNSGKSSFLKLLGLMQYSFGKNNNFSKLSFNGGTHNLGTFVKVLNWNNKSDVLSVVFDFPLDFFDEEFKLELTYRLLNEDGVLNSFKIFNNNRELLLMDDIKTDQSNNEVNFLINIDLNYIIKLINHNTLGNDINNYSKEVKDAYEKYVKDFQSVKGKLTLGRLSSLSIKRLKGKIIPGIDVPYNVKEYVDINFKEELNRMINRNIEFFGYSKAYDDLENWNEYKSFAYDFFSLKDGRNSGSLFDIAKTSNFINEMFEKSKFELDGLAMMFGLFLEGEDLIVEGVDVCAIEYKNEFDHYFVKNIGKGFDKIRFAINNINFISVNRGNRKRVLDNFSLNDIDEIIKEYYQIDKNENDINFLNKSFKLLNIKGEIVIERKEGTVSIVYIKQGNKLVSLSDLGYGYSQVIPILLKILLLNNNMNWTSNPFIVKNELNYWIEPDKKIIFPTLIIEEPEANLHPNLQSKLADIFLLAYKIFGIHIILETHSEYLIRKLQFLIASDESDLKTEDVAVYYFNNPDEIPKGEKQIYKLKIREDGFMDNDFGKGFFDEAMSLSLSLLNLKNFN